MIYKLLRFFRKKDYTLDECDCRHILYDYVFWHNSYENVWYAVHREHMTAFFAGGKDRRDVASVNGYYQSSEGIVGLIKILIDVNEKR